MKKLIKITGIFLVIINCFVFCSCSKAESLDVPKHEHSYSVFVYNSLKRSYSCFCYGCDNNLVEKAGSEAFPYLVDSVKELKAVISEAKENSFIKLTKDITVESVDFSDVFTLPAGCTLDLGGNKVLVTRAPGGFVIEGQNITLQNGIVNLTNGGDYSVFVGDVSENNSVTLKNITSNAGINVYNSMAKLIDCNIDASNCQYYAVWGDANSEIFIESGNYIGGTIACVHSTATESLVQINGGELNGKIMATLKTEINGGIINGDVVLAVYGGAMPILVVNKDYNKSLTISAPSGKQLIENLDENQNKVYTIE